jgi:hypothetical protein
MNAGMEKTIAFLERPQLAGAEFSRPWKTSLSRPALWVTNAISKYLKVSKGSFYFIAREEPVPSHIAEICNRSLLQRRKHRVCVNS